MSADLREKLKALADEIEAATVRTGLDMLAAPEPRRIREWADRIRDLVAPLATGDPEDLPAIRSLCREVTQARDPAEEDPHGERVADMLDHLEVRCRSLARRLRSRTDREPDTERRDAEHELNAVLARLRPENREQVRSWYHERYGSPPGPPVQPEEES